MSALAKAVAKASRTAVTQAASKLIVPTLTSIQVRHGGALPHSHYISREHAELQVMKLLKNYPKIPQDKLTTNAHFMNDLGLDSLDCVEVVLELEDLFEVAINDADAAHIVTVKDAIEYFANTPYAVEESFGHH